MRGVLLILVDENEVDFWFALPVKLERKIIFRGGYSFLVRTGFISMIGNRTWNINFLNILIAERQQWVNVVVYLNILTVCYRLSCSVINAF